MVGTVLGLIMANLQDKGWLLCQRIAGHQKKGKDHAK
jgi:hypothetical protein